MKEKDTIKKIIEHVGGKENMKKVWHCMTRLRFDLYDHSLIAHDKVKQLDGVIGEQLQNDQYQIIIGTNVQTYYAILMEELKLDEEQEHHQETNQKKGFFSRLLDVVSGVFGPIVPAIAGAGMVKGVIAGLIALNVLSTDTETVKILDLIASSVFYFLPFFIAASAAKIVKTNQYLAIAIAAGFMYPTLVDAAKLGEVSQFHFLGLPVPVINYSGNVIPVILSVWALSYIHKLVDKYMPHVLRTVFTPTFTLLFALPFALIVSGPFGSYVGKGLAFIVESLFDISPILAGVVMGGLRPIEIVFGMHHAMTPIALQNFADLGYDMLMPMMFMTNMAIAGATFAMFFKATSKTEKSIIVSATISALLGITEPALFGVLIKNRKAFIGCTIGSAIAATFFAIMGVRIYGYILSSIVSLVAYVGPYFTYALIGIAIAIGTSFAITYVSVKKAQHSPSLDKVNI
ncbi:PTS system, beta-glucosides-specific IIC component [Evansella caseinilytica]|uniref:PTS system, beta-glucosides-specific IIC component n=1 Tax=Evansella caseinilytica TaxID=1503961 RepID=A0A1H3I3Y0_9BACI|nr:PTS transporter subunit EIIC [Evansella caseinilytica]SDY22332.1 PTS system, beta-glucosides-specific IIC component [Evansella caseinilytica]